MTRPDLSELGLFPLGVVLLPGERVPLHVFEPRYRALVADCVLDGEPFVLALATEDGVAKTACSARFDALIRRFADGRMNVVVEGVERVEIIEQTGGRPYLSAHVAQVPDDAATPDPALAARVSDGFRRLAEQIAGAPREPETEHGTPLSYAVAGAMELEPITKQRLLESRSESERLTLVAQLIDDALEGLDRRQVASDRAQRNGKVTLQ